MNSTLWNNPGETEAYQKNAELFQNHLLEQYKLYVEMADRISSRRNLANVFFLSINTSLIGIAGFSLDKLDETPLNNLVYLLMICLIIICVVWWWMIRSYRNLNSAKFKVIGELEQKLPASPYWSAEWKALGEGRDIKKYLPLTALENTVPFLFIILYLLTAFFH